jgi:hypothetical protein
LEELGRPTAVVVTTEFRHEAEVQRDALGMPDLAPVVIDHPLSTLSDAEIDRRAEQAAEGAAKAWTGRSS